MTMSDAEPHAHQRTALADRLLEAALPHVVHQGWHLPALAAARRRSWPGAWDCARCLSEPDGGPPRTSCRVDGSPDADPALLDRSRDDEGSRADFDRSTNTTRRDGGARGCYMPRAGAVGSAPPMQVCPPVHCIGRPTPSGARRAMTQSISISTRSVACWRLC